MQNWAAELLTELYFVMKHFKCIEYIEQISLSLVQMEFLENIGKFRVEKKAIIANTQYHWMAKWW